MSEKRSVSLKWRIKNVYYDLCDWYRCNWFKERKFMKRIMKRIMEDFIDKVEKEYDELHENGLEEE